VRRARKAFFLATVLTLTAAVCLAQYNGGGFGGRGRGRGRGGWRRNNDTSGPGPHLIQTEGHEEVDEDKVRTARETAVHSTDAANWTNAAGFEKDVWTFARVKYKYGTGPLVSDSASRLGWITDYPDSDLNLSYRVQQMSSIRSDPDGRTIFLKDPDLTDYPWIYMVEVGRLELRDEEVPILRKYLLNGGMLMVDDFWGEIHWANLTHEIKKVFPDRDFKELPMEHPLFHSVFDLKVPKSRLQTPGLNWGLQSLDPNSWRYGMTWESHDGEECQEFHVRAITDDKDRIMVIATHNCDNGDGWEREGENGEFFHEFSEKRAFPLGINIIFYAMTH
jgi:hypothetical protein